MLITAAIVGDGHYSIKKWEIGSHLSGVTKGARLTSSINQARTLQMAAFSVLFSMCDTVL